MTDPDGLLDAFEADFRGAVPRLEAGEHLERDLTADRLEWAIGALDRRVASLAQTLKSALIRIEDLEAGS